MQFEKLKATAVVRKNSIDFIEQVFSLNAARRPLVMVADEAQAGKLAGIEVDRCIVPSENAGWFSARHPLIHDDLPAQVSYTSGTEGKPKGILLTYANMADASERIIDQMQMTSEIREYVGVPATFSFGMGRYRAISAVGGRAYLPPRGFDPLELARMLAAGQVNALSAVPTLLRILLDRPEVIGTAGDRLRWMEIGSQHMTADEKARVRQMFPNARIVQHYGLTEASRSTFLQISEATDDELESVGRPVGKTEVGLHVDGRIRIRGPHVAASRIDAEGLHELQDSKGWLQTNDLGHLRDGFLYFDGRADDLINCGGVKVVPDQLEDRIRAGLVPGVQVAVAKVPDAQRGDGVLVAVEAGQADPGQVKTLAVAALQDMGVAVGGALHVLAVDAIPVTGTGKVQRRELAKQFEAQRPAEPAPGQTAKKAEIGDVISLFRHEFPGQRVRLEDTFETLGGDSLHYIQFSLAFEQRFGQLMDNWEKLSVAELQDHVATSKKTIWRRLEPATLTRAFFIICILALHTDAFVYSSHWGAAYVMIALAGYSVARFQLPEIIRTGSVKTLVGTIKYIAIATVLMVALLQVYTERFEILPLLLVSNYLDPYTLKGYAFYFPEFYVQILAIAAILFSFNKVREAFSARPLTSALVLLVAVIAIDLTVEAIWDGEYNYHRTPWNYGWAFVLGMLLAMAKDFRTRAFVLGVSTVLALFKWGFTSGAMYFDGGAAVVLFLPVLVVPAPVKVIVGEIAGASMFFMLSHEQITSILDKVFGQSRPWTALFTSIVVGVVLAHLYAWASRKTARMIEAAREDGTFGRLRAVLQRDAN